MKIEHVAYQVQDPAAFARWYEQHLGMTIKRVQPDPPFGHFLADDGDAVMLEVYNNPKVAVPDYRQVDPFLLHIAFVVDDVQATGATKKHLAGVLVARGLRQALARLGVQP